MKKTVRRRHNKDGTVTKTTTYSHKNIFGTRVYETYTEHITPKEHTYREIKINPVYIAAIAVAVAVAVFATAFIMAETVIGKICSVALMIIALIITAFVVYHKYTSQGNAQQSAESTEHWCCPKCDFNNSISDIYCENCNYKYDPTKAVRKEKAAPRTWICAECGAKNAGNIRYCMVCNEPRSDDLNNMSHEKNKSIIIALCAIIIVVLITFAFCVIVSLSHGII